MLHPYDGTTRTTTTDSSSEEFVNYYDGTTNSVPPPERNAFRDTSGNTQPGYEELQPVDTARHETTRHDGAHLPRSSRTIRHQQAPPTGC